MNELALRVDPKTTMFRADFAANAEDLPGAGLPWLDERRFKAMQIFAEAGVPTRRVEAWKYTDLAGALDDALEPATPFRAEAEETGALADPFAGLAATRVVLANGYLQYIGGEALPDAIDVVDLAELSARTPEWVKDHLGQKASGADQALGAVSLALMRGGIAIRVRAGAANLPPLHLRFLNPGRGQPLASHARVLIVLEQGATLDLVESHAGLAQHQLLANLGVEILLGAGARLNHVRLQEEPDSVVHIASVAATLGKDAAYRALFAILGGKLSRIDANIKLAEPGAEAHLRSLAVLTGEAVADVTTILDHAAPHTTSRQLFKSVVAGRARSVAQGRVSVREGAVKSDSHQLFRALLLAPRAEADAKPELEIFADDVVCGHGTAIGALDADALFDLRSRGVPEAEARSMLVRAFLEDVLSEMGEPELRNALWARVDAALAATGGDA
jgi:Fe-S cluster assembly protein SufD